MSEKNSPTEVSPQRKATGKSASAAKTPSTQKTTKSDAVISLLSRPGGATLDEMMKATGWQAHSVRGFLAGTLKRKSAAAPPPK
jgi:hypothetical protein